MGAWVRSAISPEALRTVAFVVKSDMAAWQEVWWIAADTGKGLKQLSLEDDASFDHQRPEVPEVQNNFLANAVDHGTLVSKPQTPLRRRPIPLSSATGHLTYRLEKLGLLCPPP
jgi:hypothetical protein